jgi:hypothetical protein
MLQVGGAGIHHVNIKEPELTKNFTPSICDFQSHPFLLFRTLNLNISFLLILRLLYYSSSCSIQESQLQVCQEGRDLRNYLHRKIDKIFSVRTAHSSLQLASIVTESFNNPLTLICSNLISLSLNWLFLQRCKFARWCQTLETTLGMHVSICLFWKNDQFAHHLYVLSEENRIGISRFLSMLF